VSRYIFPGMQDIAFESNGWIPKKLTLLPFWPANAAVGDADANCLIGCFVDETKLQVQVGIGLTYVPFKAAWAKPVRERDASILVQRVKKII